MGHLAITGGSRVKRTPFPSYPIWDKEDESTLIDVLHSGKWSKGPQNYKNGEYIERFEKRMGALHNAKYALEQDECVMIGDAANDIQSAENAGISSIAVSWGEYPYDKLISLRPSYIVDKPSEILNCIYSLNSEKRKY